MPVLGVFFALVTVVAVVAAVLVLTIPEEKEPKVAAADAPEQVAPAVEPAVAPATPPLDPPAPRPQPRPTTNPTPAAEPPPETVVPAFPPLFSPSGHSYRELFNQQVTPKPPPKVLAASLRPVDPELEPDVPTFYSLMLARKPAKSSTSKPPPKNTKLTLEELKKACAFIKIDAAELSATGSGFLIASVGTTGLVATNYHVIEAAASPGYGSGSAKVYAVFNSGLADEQVLKADVVAFDTDADLAILKVESSLPWPKPINPYNTPPSVIEGTPIQFWGFPLGEILASGKKNPEITLGTGTVSSLRYTTSGKLDKVQISGTMNPGNSGGPLVDSDGRLVGIAVSIINPKIGTGIGFAVPVNNLIALLEGKLLTSLFIPLEIDDGMAYFLAVVPVMDPMDRVDKVYIRRWAGAGQPPPVVKDRFTGHKPFGMHPTGLSNLPGVEEFPLKKFLTDSEMASSLGIALGEVAVPVNSEKIMLQVASQTGPHPQTGIRFTAASTAVPYTLRIADMPVGDDAKPFTDLTKDPDSLAGKVVVVRGRVLAPPVTQEPVQDVIIADERGKKPPKMKFLVDAAQAYQFDEVALEHQPLPVRLVCLVGERGSDGVVPVRVARLDFIGRGKRIVHTIPDPNPSANDLAALNRDTKRFAGKTLQLNVSAAPITPKTKDSNEFSIIFSNHRPPRNLSFTITTAMKIRMLESFGHDLRPNAIVPVRVTAVVPPKTALPGAKTEIKLTKIDFLDDDGNVIKSVE